MEQNIKYRDHTIKITRDDDCESPDAWGDNNLFLIGNHRQFYVKPPRKYTFDNVLDNCIDTHFIFKLEAYIHSGVVLALSSEGDFCDRQWDVSQLGYVFVSKEEWPDIDKAIETARSYIETWNDYLSGNVYGYDIEDVHSCSGYYGDPDKSGLIEDAKANIDSYIKRQTEKHIANRKLQIKAKVPLQYRKELAI